MPACRYVGSLLNFRYKLPAFRQAGILVGATKTEKFPAKRGGDFL